MTISLRRALLGLVLLVLLVGLVPAGVLLDRRLVAALEQSVSDDLSAAVMILRDRFANQSSARMMHARDVAGAGLARALSAGDTVGARAHADAVVSAFPGERAVVVGPDGVSWTGPQLPGALVDSTRAGAMPVAVVRAEAEVGTVALAPATVEERWTGAAGVWVPMASEEVAQLAALTRSDVLLVAPDGELGAYTGRAEPAMGLFALIGSRPATEEVEELLLDGARYRVATAELPGGARVTFVRPLEEALAIVPALRAVGSAVLLIALLIALLVGAWTAGRLAEPVGSLAEAAAGVTRGEFDVSVVRSGVTEVEQVGRAFEAMRDALAARIAELSEANRELEDRQRRLSTLQAELVQRDRLSAAARLLAQLAHEVRNPVASVRNCLEVLRRRVSDDPEASQLAELAIDELLRMHELAERMLDLHRPRSEGGDCDASAVAQDVAALVRMGMGDQDVVVTVVAPEPVPSGLPADALKQVLLNLVQNAQEAVGGEGHIEIRVGAAGTTARIEVLDDGPGIGAERLPQIFDPFFTTKADVRGVGLGLFTAAGIVASHGGRITAADRRDGAGAALTVEVPLAVAAHAAVGA